MRTGKQEDVGLALMRSHTCLTLSKSTLESQFSLGRICHNHAPTGGLVGGQRGRRVSAVQVSPRLRVPVKTLLSPRCSQQSTGQDRKRAPRAQAWRGPRAAQPSRRHRWGEANSPHGSAEPPPSPALLRAGRTLAPWGLLWGPRVNPTSQTPRGPQQHNTEPTRTTRWKCPGKRAAEGTVQHGEGQLDRAAERSQRMLGGDDTRVQPRAS